MKKLAMVLVLGFSAMTVMACSKPHKVETAKAEVPVAAPAPPPPAPEQPKVGEQLTLPEQIEFETNEARIMQTQKTLAALDKLAETMKTHPNITKLRIEGHTDNVGKAKRNEKLSKARADAVAKWLGQHDVEANRLVTLGFGAKRPLVANDSADHRALNRRTEYYIDELDGKPVDDSAKVASGSSGGAGGVVPGGGKTTN